MQGDRSRPDRPDRPDRAGRPGRPGERRLRAAGKGGLFGLAAALAVWGLACSNNPYPDADETRAVYYTSISEAPRTLDPAKAYNVTAHAITGNVYDKLLEYHYLKRPYELIPSLAKELPVAEELPDGRVRYRFVLREGLVFAEDPCFELGGEGRKTREILASDVAFQLSRVADPATNSPVVDPFSNIQGFREFGKRLSEAREADAAFAEKPLREQYEAAGGIEGVATPDDLTLEVTLAAAYPQILYWFAMGFTTPVPWEAVEYYDGVSNERFDDHPVGSGPFRISRYDKQSRIVLERNPRWYGAEHPEWRAPGAVYPSEGEPGDAEKGLLDAAGRPLPFIDRIEFRREKESIPLFNKFLQGYYDSSGIIKESFDKVIRDDRLSPEMAAMGVRLDKSISPGVYYLGFNMEDPVLGAEGGDRSRKLRQAISLAVDAQGWIDLFLNGRGVLAQTPVPPGLFGYDPDYQNPARVLDRDRARELLVDAGYPGGIDPETDRPLRITFDTPSTSSAQLLRDQFIADGLREIGLDVQIAATTYNQFQKKVKDGSYQLFFWGWSADYPDPENFYFLLTCDMRQSQGGGPNTANFCDPEFEALFERMRVRGNDEERMEVIREMRALLERERPWVELLHPESYALLHGWLDHVKTFGMSFPMHKYRAIDTEARALARDEWNRPVTWPAYALAAVGVAIVLPGIFTFFRERQ
ncbi:MAG: ABC transporter substrate-binding protein [Myxococcota bacterium]|nr:ABC transporter substrate-binding protein [Myxococcota bacterium]